MSDSNFQVEQPCPQCGAPILIDETDRILPCQYCRTRVYLATDDHFRFYLPPQKDIADDIFFIPYWRVRGLSYAISPPDITYKYFDTNILALESDLLPHSLGLRPQAMTLRFVGRSNQPGRYLACSRSVSESLLKKYQKNSWSPSHQDVYIGETKSVIYTPVYIVHHQLYDAILKKPLLNQAATAHVQCLFEESAEETWQVQFIPLLCPNCGADLPGKKDALILFCNNCQSAWNPSVEHFPRVGFSTRQVSGEGLVYLPFWQLRVNVTGLQLQTYADFIKLANLPKAPADIWTRTPFYFQIPAFKITPSLFLRWCRQMTAQPAAADLSDALPSGKIYPVTLPASEALEACLITLTSLMAEKRQLFEVMSSVRFELKTAEIVLHPFRVGARELIHAEWGFSLDIASLNWGAYL